MKIATSTLSQTKPNDEGPEMPENAPHSDENIEPVVEEDFYKEENLRCDILEPAEEKTPLGKKYILRVSSYKSREGCWDVTKGVVTDLNGNVIAEVKRNYSHFWHCYVEHPNGHQYLLCGEDYQGQTVVELDTGKRVDYLPPEAEKGCGFCWISCEFQPDGVELVVEGCYWACPCERVIHDFSNPMQLPYQEKHREDIEFEDDDDE